MTTIDTLMALADNYATLTADTAAVTSARETLRTALTEALAQQAEQGWQPISTAPKDGTEILIYSSPIKYFSVRYRNRRIAWWVCGQLGDYDGYWGTEVFFDGRSIVQHAHNATHWMPLPSPPKETK